MKKFQGNDTNKLFERERKHDAASSGLTETNITAGTSHAKANSGTETSVDKQAIVAWSVSALATNTDAIGIGEACSYTSSSCGNVEKFARPRQPK